MVVQNYIPNICVNDIHSKILKSWAMKKPWLFRVYIYIYGTLLPSYDGNITYYYKNPYEWINIKRCFFWLSCANRSRNLKTDYLWCQEIFFAGDVSTSLYHETHACSETDTNRQRNKKNQKQRKHPPFCKKKRLSEFQTRHLLFYVFRLPTGITKIVWHFCSLTQSTHQPRSTGSPGPCPKDQGLP